MNPIGYVAIEYSSGGSPMEVVDGVIRESAEDIREVAYGLNRIPGDERYEAAVIVHTDDLERLVAERDADRAEIVALCQERLQLKAELDETRAGELAAARNEPGHALPEDRDHAVVAYFRLFLQWRHQRERADQAEAAIDRVRALHRGLRIYDECGHKHDASDPGAKWIDEVGFVCEDGYMYTICGECCRDGDYQSEHCANDHSHTVCHPCPTLAILSGSGT